ncbi:MAG: hypothetical protein ACE5J9_05525 [Methanosarcinales archaeon]
MSNTIITKGMGYGSGLILEGYGSILIEYYYDLLQLALKIGDIMIPIQWKKEKLEGV